MSGIAIIGLALRLPGAGNVRQFWENLCDKVESIQVFSDEELLAAGVPRESITDPTYVKAAPTLADVDKFDAAFFGYTPKEAILMDPQNRLFLEICAAAFDDAGYAPAMLGEQRVGVFAGGGGALTSYLLAYCNHPALRGQTAGLEHIANDRDFLATRVSFKLNLTGPGVTVQTACSTSLVAVHLAVQSLLNRECEMALAGASVVRIPHTAGYFAERGSVHSADGHCRPFDANGSGTIFGSGVAAVLLKPVDAALADGDSIYAVIKGTVAANDGSEKVSYTASSATGQARAIVEALAVADVSPDTLSYVECHATGTPAGDPVEIQALTRAFRLHTNRTGFCAVGSVKGNIGHPEQAAGMAGLIKVALALKHRMIPPTAGYTIPNPGIDWGNSPFRVQGEITPWPSGSHPRRAGVNSLGIGGTNAFVLLEEAPTVERPERRRKSHPFCLSAKSDEDLRAYAREFISFLQAEPEVPLGDLCHTSNLSRSHWRHRFAAVCESQEQLSAQLTGFVSSGVSAATPPSQPKVAFVFAGQGSQYHGMGRHLYDEMPAFRAAFDECADVLSPLLHVPVTDLVFATGDNIVAPLDETRFTQPALFALEYSLAKLWQSWGVTPAAVIGHSLGEIVAACIAGFYDLRQALEFVVERAERMQLLDTRGGMEVFFASESSIVDALNGLAGELNIAAVNGPRSVVVAGATGPLAAFSRQMMAAGVESKSLTVSHAFHSPLVEPILPGLEECAGRLRVHRPRIPVISNRSGRLFDAPPKAAYWSDHARNTVRFSDGMQTLRDLGCTVFIEIGPAATSIAMGRDCLEGPEFQWLRSLGGKKIGSGAILESSAAVYLAGGEIDWSKVSEPASRRISLPSYPFARKRFWLSPIEPVLPREPPTIPRDPPPAPGFSMDLDWSRATVAYLADHQVYGLPVIPTASVLVAALAAGRRHFGEAANVLVEDFVCQRALVDTGAGNRRFRLTLTPSGPDVANWRIESADPVTVHAAGVMRRVTATAEQASEPPPKDVLAQGLLLPRPKADYYAWLRRIGLNYGPAFQNVRKLWAGDGQAIARVSMSPRLAAESRDVHPALLDACIHLYPALMESTESNGQGAVFLPVAVERFTVHRRSPFSMWAHVISRQLHDRESSPVVDIRLVDRQGRRVATLDGLRLKRLTRNALLCGAVELGDRVVRVAWRERDAAFQRRTLGPWLVFGGNPAPGVPGLAARIVEGLRRVGRVVHVAPGDRYLNSTADFAEALHVARAAEGTPFERILCLCSLEARWAWREDPLGVAAAEAAAVKPALHLSQALSAAEGFDTCTLWFATRGAQSVFGVDPADPIQAQLWGLGRTIALEAPRMWGGILDLPAEPDADAIEALINALAADDEESQVAVRGRRRYLARLETVSITAPDSAPIPLRPDATYLITGGTGMLGLKCARWLVERGARHLVLASRRGLAPEAQPEIEALEALDSSIWIANADLSQEHQVSRLLDLIAREMPPLRGVIHGAGVLADGIFSKMTWDNFLSSTGPKAHGAWFLHHHTRHLPLDFFLLQSTLLSLTGSAGQVNYTAANAFLDALVDLRRSEGLTANAINWGPWALAGMAADGGIRGDGAWRKLGIALIQPEDGIRALGRIFDSGEPHAAAVECDWDRYAASLHRASPFYAELTRNSDSRQRPRGPEVNGSRTPLATSGGILEALRKTIARELGIEEQLEPNVRLEDLGVDSLMSVTLVNRLEAVLGLRIPLAILLQSPTVEELASGLERVTGSFAGNGSKPASLTLTSGRQNGWLVIPRPNPAAKARLFCFNFAGGGASTYRPWADLLDPSIELVAIEPPGRASRIQEPPVRTLRGLLDGLIPEMMALQDKPAAFIGHCLGGLNVFETVRALLPLGANPFHLFFSGSRPPHRLLSFGRFEENLYAGLLKLPAFDPLKPLHEQPDEVFAEVILRFNIGATGEFLARPELRTALFPAIRADFETVYRYRHVPEAPWDIPITCFIGLDDPYVTREDGLEWSRYTSSEFRAHFRNADHFLIVSDRAHIVATINETLAMAARRGFQMRPPPVGAKVPSPSEQYFSGI